MASPDVVVRTAALPVATLRQLRCERTHAEIGWLLDAAAGLTAEAGALSGELHALVATLTGEPRRHAVGLRRALHRRRDTAGPRRALGVALPPALRDRVVRWESRRDEHSRRSAALPGLLSDELAERVAELRRLTADPVFLQGLASTRPPLLRAVLAWQEDAEERPPRRRTLLRLSRYLLRTAAKTSPRSSFTTLALGEWVDEPPRAERSGPPPESTVQPHALVVAAVVAAVARHDGLRHAVGLRLNPGRLYEGDRLRWLVPTATSPLAGTRLTAALRALLVEAEHGTFTRAELVERLVAATAGGAQPIDRDRAAELLDALVRARLLLPVPPVLDQSGDQLGDLLRWLDQVRRDTGLPASLHSLHRDLASAHARLPLLADQRLAPRRWLAERESFERELRGAAVAAGVLGDDDALPDGTGLYDHRVVRGAAVPLPAGAWSPVLDDVNLVRRMLALFDPKLPFRLELARLFAETHGPGARVPYLAFFRDCHAADERTDRLRWLHALRMTLSPEQEQAALAAAGEHGGERLAEVLALRAALVADLAALRPDADGVVRPSVGLLRDRVAKWPRHLSPPGSVTAFLQEHAPGRAVLNGVDTGYGHGLARVRRLVRGDRGPLPDPGPEPRDGRPLLAEWDHAFGSTLNVRCAGVPYTIDYPGLVADRPADRVLPLHELTVVHDASAGSLRLEAPGHGPVRPVYSGGNWEALLPPAARFVMDGFAEPPMFLAPQSWWLNEPVRRVPGRVRRLPRLELGRLTVRRAVWAVGAAMVPRRDAGEQEAAYLLRFVAWTRDNGIPDRCFVRVLEPGAGRVVARAKPMPLDTGNWFSVMAFEARLGGGQDLVLFTEELPELSGDEGRHVRELVVEVSDPAVRDG
ncbi:lantibiotic dehydratase [Streptomyces sp. ODS05-4]|uniref:lantibiotic dehydratase n=1 Tax=Streptomyces sp. ODS05-4 TaxID=2944939 RepID=UPI00210B466E|nr:lantibiotic dehydratase [Streptomyces sp. ODS05-4]